MAEMQITVRELSDAQLAALKGHIDEVLVAQITALEGRLRDAITKALAPPVRAAIPVPPPPKFDDEGDLDLADLTLDDPDDDED